MTDKVYIVDYDSVTYLAGGKGIGFQSKYIKEIGRNCETQIFYEKAEAIKTIIALLEDNCIENIKLSNSLLERDYLNISDIVDSEK